jgi:hypothetical protein
MLINVNDDNVAQPGILSGRRQFFQETLGDDTFCPGIISRSRSASSGEKSVRPDRCFSAPETR